MIRKSLTLTAVLLWTVFSFAQSSGGNKSQRTMTCHIVIGADNGSALVDADISPQKGQCYFPRAATITQVQIEADAGTPLFNVSKNHAGSQTALLSGTLSTAAAGAIACSNAGGTLGLDGVTTCSNTLTTTAIAAGDYIDITSGTAGGVAKRISISITFITSN